MTLLFGLLLLVGAGILAFSAGRTGIVEQRIASNERSAIEAEQAAQSGLEYAQAWLARHTWSVGSSLPSAPSVQAGSGQRFGIALDFKADSRGLCVRAQARALDDAGLSAVAHACFSQSGLFAVSPETRMPPPLVLSGCMSSAPGGGELYLLQGSRIAAASGAAAQPACLPRGGIETAVWEDRDASRALSADEKGASAPYRRARFAGCPGDHCAWRQFFALDRDRALKMAEDAGHVFSNRIPCGGAAAPGIYVIGHAGSIDALDISGGCSAEPGVDGRTIGSPSRPVLLLVRAAGGCPVFTRDLRVYGIVYFMGGCDRESWQGAKIQGALIWEGDAQAPGEHSQLVETDYGAGSELNAAFQVVTGAARLPGTWRDWD